MIKKRRARTWRFFYCQTIRHRLLNAICMAACVSIPVACGPGPAFTGDQSYVADTSKAFRENRVLALGDPRDAAVLSNKTPKPTTSVRDLLPIWDPNTTRHVSNENRITPNPEVARLNDDSDIDQTNASLFIKHGQPLSVVVHSVRIPESVRGSRDIAVVLDIRTGKAADEGVTSLVVWYQRNVRGGMTLGFQGLLVYSTDNWDSASPPYFRLRLVDVKAERNTRTAALLDASSELASSFGDLIPSPYIPIVNTAINAAKAILANRKNEVLIDYSIQFYSSAFADLSRSDIGALRRGSWMAVGRPKGWASRFWRLPLVFDRYTGEVFDERAIPATPVVATNGTAPVVTDGIQSPYVAMTLVPMSANVYDIVRTRSEALLRIITQSDADLATIEQLGEDTAKSIRTFVLIRTARKQRSKDSIRQIFLSLNSRPEDLDVNALLLELSRVAPDAAQEGHFDSKDKAFKWWSDGGKDWILDAEAYLLKPPSTDGKTS